MKKIKTENKIICENPNSMFNYFGWPSVNRLPDGTLAMVCSGFRLSHVCPFGKSVICYSRDEGKTWTKPAVVIDTPEDDRDSGIVTFGGKVMLNTFNCGFTTPTYEEEKLSYFYQLPVALGYMSQVDREEADKHFAGSLYAISDDGYEFGPVQRCPVQTPHGGCVLPDGRIFFVGRHYDEDGNFSSSLHCYLYDENNNWIYVSEIPCPEDAPYYCEPHVIALDDKIIVHIRTHDFKMLQCESYDGGKSFTEPHVLVTHGSPPHLLRHSSGVLICSYGYRLEPFGQRIMLSYDNGETWEIDYILRDDAHSGDLGYPATVELKDGSLLTVYYQKPAGLDNTVIMQSIWRLPQQK